MAAQKKLASDTQGFTLIELSIVLVIIGLIVGGVLVGQELIRAAEIRATISQIEKYNTAVNTFRGKFGGLPGDIDNTIATNFGLYTPRGWALAPAVGLTSSAGLGDNNGVLQGYLASNGAVGTCINGGEQVMFWRDLSDTGLIDGHYLGLSANSYMGINNTATTTLFNSVLPQTKMAGNNYIYVWSDINNVNYYGMSSLIWLGSCTPNSNSGIRVSTAYNIDRKIDDGLPQSGRVNTQYLDQTHFGGTNGYSYSTSAATGNATTCSDNGGPGGSLQYSIAVNAGADLNCGLSLQLQ